VTKEEGAEKELNTVEVVDVAIPRFLRMVCCNCCSRVDMGSIDDNVMFLFIFHWSCQGQVFPSDKLHFTFWSRNFASLLKNEICLLPVPLKGHAREGCASWTHKTFHQEDLAPISPLIWEIQPQGLQSRENLFLPCLFRLPHPYLFPRCHHYRHLHI